MNPTKTKPSGGAEVNSNWVDVVRQFVGTIRFGVVEITIHDSRVVQIERTERLRLGGAEGNAQPGRGASSEATLEVKPGGNPSAPR